MIIRARVNRRLAIFEWEPVETKKWIDVSILQMEEFGTHMLTVTVNGVREFVALNKKVDDVEGITVWAGNPWEDAQPGVIRNINFSHP